MNFKTLVTLILVTFSFSVFAQDINQAGEVFNEGNQAVKAGDYVTAIQKYEESLKIASKLGAEGEQIVSGAKAQIPSLYYKLGAADYKEKKIDKAIDEFGNAIKYGNEYGDIETVEKSEEIIPKLFYAKGNSLYKAKKYDEALESFEQSKEYNPNYSRAFWGMGLAYSKKFKGVYESIDMKELVIDLRRRNHQQILEKIDWAIEHRLEYKSRLEMIMPSVTLSVSRLFESVD